MLPYFLMYALILTSSLVDCFYSQSDSRALQFIFSPKLIFFLTFLFAALRGNGNGDYYNYLEGVKQVDSLNFVFNSPNYPFEFGFRFLSYINNLLNLNPQFVLISMNMISFSSIYYVIKKTNTRVSLATFAFFPIVLLYDMHHSRSAVTMSLGMVFFIKLWDYEARSWWKAFFYLVLAFLFHKSAVNLLVFIPIVYYYKYKFNLKRYSLGRDLTISLLILILTIFVSITMEPIHGLVEFLDGPYTMYFYQKMTSYLSSPRWSYPFNLYDPRLIASTLFYFSFYILMKENKTDNFYHNIHKIYLFSIIMLIFFSESTILAMRMYYLFNIIIILYLPRILESQSCGIKSRKYVKYFVLFVYIVYSMALITQQVSYSVFFVK